MNKHESQRGYFAFELYQLMKTNKDIFLLTGDLGFLMFDDIQKDYPDRFINTGASEQSLVDISIGLAMSGKTVIAYSITPFLLYRAFEGIRNYIHEEKIPVILVGGGRNKDYDHDGFSHWACEDRAIMKILKNIKCYWPETKAEVPKMLRQIIKSKKPSYLNLTRN